MQDLPPGLRSEAAPCHWPSAGLSDVGSTRTTGCLERVSSDALVSAASAASAAACGGRACLQPTIDGVELNDEPRRLMPSANLSSIGLLMGAGIDEGDGFDAGSSWIPNRGADAAPTTEMVPTRRHAPSQSRAR